MTIILRNFKKYFTLHHLPYNALRHATIWEKRENNEKNTKYAWEHAIPNMIRAIKISFAHLEKPKPFSRILGNVNSLIVHRLILNRYQIQGRAILWSMLFIHRISKIKWIPWLYCVSSIFERGGGDRSPPDTWFLEARI